MEEGGLNKSQKKESVKQTKLKNFRQYSLFRNPGVVVFVLLFATVGSYYAFKGFAASPHTTTSTTTNSPMTVTNEYYNWRTPAYANTCISEDTWMDWAATGSLKPGESYTFTPKYPLCAQHSRFAQVTWQGSTKLVLSTALVGGTSTFDNSHDYNLTGKVLTGAQVGNKATVCAYDGGGLNRLSDGTIVASASYSYTILNEGTVTATNIQMTGKDRTAYIDQEYYKCILADADGDGWNDGIEYTMAVLSETSNFTGLNGTAYLRATGTASADDEFDFTPPDFNDDGKIDQTDLDKINAYLGQGSGVTLDQVRPLQGFGAWRRFDLNGDGKVNQEDVNMVIPLVGQTLPITKDIILPTAHMTNANGDIASKGSYYQLNAFASDNGLLAKVEFYVDSSLVYTQYEPAYNAGNENLTWPSIFNYWWKVPRKGGAYSVYAKAYDAAGNSKSSTPVNVIAQ